MSSSSAPSVDEILGSVSTALRGDRTKVRALVKRTRSRLVKQARQKLKKEVDGTIAELRGVKRKQNKSKKKPAKRKGPTGARVATPKPPAPLAPRRVRLRLPNGRVVRGRVAREAAQRNDLANLRKFVGSTAGRSVAAIQHNSRSIDSLAKSQREMAKLIAELQGRGDLTVLRALLDALAGLELKCSRGLRKQDKALKRQRKMFEGKLARQGKALRRALQVEKRASQIQKLNSTASSLQFAAFGQSGAMGEPNNVRLAAIDLAGKFVGDILDAVGLTTPGKTSAIAWLTPVATMAAAQAIVDPLALDIGAKV